jgi:hypothetical protein
MGDYTRVSLGKDSSGRPLVLNQRTLDMFREVERLIGRELTIVQGSYRAGNGASASAGTHDGGGVIDVRTYNLTVAERNAMIEHARMVGFAAWYRTKAQGFDPHSHWNAIGDEDMPVSAQNQVTQYKHGLNGLASYGDDDGPDGYRNVTWESYKAARALEGILTVDQADRIIAHINAVQATKGSEGQRYADLKTTENRTYAALQAFRAEEAGRYSFYARKFADLEAKLTAQAAEIAALKESK